MLTLSGSGRLRDVRPEPDDDGELQGVGVIVDAENVHFPRSRNLPVYLHWMCGEDEAQAWIDLLEGAPGTLCYFSGVGPLVEDAEIMGDDVPFFEVMAHFVAPSVLARVSE